jgi:polysaccharide pyruvyl transferase WcaK-like protein
MRGLQVVYLLGKRVEFTSAGMYDTASFLDRFLVNPASLLSDKLSVRDEESFKNLWRPSRRKARIVDDLSIPYLRRHRMNLEKDADFVKLIPE